ncbi:MAG: glycosyltransferase family 4 protein [Kiritimatiellia bacterium]
MNVLVLTENVFPDVTGGSGRVVTQTCKGLVKSGHHVHVITRLINGSQLEEEREEGIRISRYRVSRFVWNTLHSVSRSIRAASRDTAFDIVSIHQPFPGLVGVRSRPLRGVPKIRTFHGPWHEEYRVSMSGEPNIFCRLKLKIGTILRRCADAYVLSRVDMVRVLSNYAARMACEICPSCSQRTRIIPGGVDAESFRPPTDKKAVRKQLDLPEDRQIIFTVRNLTRRMGLDTLIEAMRDVRRRIHGALLIIGGQGAMRAELEEQIDRSGLIEHVRLAGRIPDEDLPLYYQSADLFVLPTRDLEGFGLVTLEAMASGLPVLATPQGGSIELLEQFGRECLFSGTSALEIGEKIVETLSSREKLRDLGHKVRRAAVEQYSWNRQVDELEALFNELSG